MTVWDNIYKKHLRSGEGYGTISKDIYPLFIQFIRETNFIEKSALDIGFGTGKYLKLLQEAEFQVAGIDNSEMAVEMTKELLGRDADLRLANMYNYQIPKDRYDLVLSVSTLHHGTKEEVKDLIKNIYDSLLPSGKVFITLPDYTESWHAKSKDLKEISKGTYIHLTGPEKDLPHSLFSEAEIKSMFLSFKDVSMNSQSGRWFVMAIKD